MLLAAVMLGIAGCQRSTPTSPVPALDLRFTEPVVAQFVPATSIFSAEFPVTVSDPAGRGGTLAFVETTVVNRSRGLVVATNRRPNAEHAYGDTHLPAGRSLTVDAAVGFPPPPPRDELVITVRVRLTDDRQVERTALLLAPF